MTLDIHRLIQMVNRVDNRIRVELYLELDGKERLYTRTIFENHPDPKLRPRMMNWTYEKLDEKGLMRGIKDPTVMVADYIIQYWARRRREVDAEINACDCKLVAGHETWCHKWEAY